MDASLSTLYPIEANIAAHLQVVAVDRLTYFNALQVKVPPDASVGEAESRNLGLVQKYTAANICPRQVDGHTAREHLPEVQVSIDMCVTAVEYDHIRRRVQQLVEQSRDDFDKRLPCRRNARKVNARHRRRIPGYRGVTELLALL
jgi:hypothetical protein